MAPSGRAVSALVAFGVGYALVGGLAFSLFAPTAPAGFRAAAGLGCGMLAAVAVWRISTDAKGLGTAMARGAALLGGIGFIGGFFGPMIFTPSANQGPMLGIFISGPIGLALGAIAGGARWALVRRRT